MSYKANLFEAIASEGTDRDFAPRITSEFRPTRALAGSREKIGVLRWRLEHGLPLFHELDGKAAAGRFHRTDRVPGDNKASQRDSFS